MQPGEQLHPTFPSCSSSPRPTAARFSANRTISASTQVQGGDFNLYEGMRCHGVPLVTISRGRLVCENGVFMCAEGSGKFYPQRTFPDFLYKKMVQREKVCWILFSQDLFLLPIIFPAVSGDHTHTHRVSVSDSGL